MINALTQFANHCSQDVLFGFPTWNKYLDFQHDSTGACTLTAGFELGDIWLIAAAILEIMVRLAGLLAVIFIVVGGFKYITSAGNPERTTQARRSIINAMVGLVIAVVATRVISYIANALSGDTGGGLFVRTPADAGAIDTGLDIAHAVAAATAVIMIVIGGLQFVTGGGDPKKIASARSTIIYSLIGLVIVIFSAVITSFVLGSFE